jgi:hypothetical protein
MQEEYSAISGHEAPVRFSPSVERLGADEAETTQAFIATMRYINERTFADGGRAIKSVHAKTGFRRRPIPQS